MRSYGTEALGQLCDVSIGRTPRRNEAKYWGGPHPWATIRDLDGGTLMDTGEGITDAALDEVMPHAVEPGTLLFSFKLSIGKMGFAGRAMHHNEAIAALPVRNPGVLDREFLFYALKAMTHDGDANHAVLGKVLNKRKVEQIEISVPPMDEQRRIVAILKRAAKIERLRARAAERLGEFVPALFVKMFGDPVENLRGWDVALLGEVIQGFEAGKNVMAGNGTTPLRILKVSAVTSGEFDPSMSKPAPDDYVAPKRHRVRVGDLLISRANTSDLVGATAMVEREAPDVLLPDKIWRFVWRADPPVEPRFVHGLFQNRATRGVISAMASGTSSSMKNISQAKLKKLRIIVPPLERQKQYAELVAKAREVECRAAIAGTRAAETSASLMTELLAKH